MTLLAMTLGAAKLVEMTQPAMTLDQKLQKKQQMLQVNDHGFQSGCRGIWRPTIFDLIHLSH